MSIRLDSGNYYSSHSWDYYILTFWEYLRSGSDDGFIPYFYYSELEAFLKELWLNSWDISTMDILSIKRLTTRHPLEFEYVVQFADYHKRFTKNLINL